MGESVDGSVGRAHIHQTVILKFDGEDKLLDSQGNYEKKWDALNIYDGVQTLKSKRLGGDVRVTAKKEERVGNDRLQ